jgi:hypothetical protein
VIYVAIGGEAFEQAKIKVEKNTKVERGNCTVVTLLSTLNDPSEQHLWLINFSIYLHCKKN